MVLEPEEEGVTEALRIIDPRIERIAFIGGAGGLPQLRERYEGVVAAVGDRTGDPDALTVLTPQGLTVAGGREAASRLLGLPAGRRPTAAICANDLLALGVLQEMVRQGVRVPEESAIIGYDDIDYASAAAVPLTSVRKPRHELGRRAAELLLDEAAGGDGEHPHVHQQPVFSPELVVRESSTVRHRRAATT